VFLRILVTSPDLFLPLSNGSQLSK
jgi:hypothetical protein